MTKKFLLYSSPFMLLFIAFSLLEPYFYVNFFASTSLDRLKGKDFVVIAHKGASGEKLAPENTLPAIEMALEMGVDMIELDVRHTKDEEIVVFHDATLERTTNFREWKEANNITDDRGSGVEAYTLEEIKQLDAGSWKDSKWTGTQVPTLKEALDLIDGRCQVLIEIKHMDHPHYHDFSEKLVEVIHKEKKGVEWIILQSYEQEYIDDVHELDDHIQTKRLIIGEDSAPLLAFYLETRMLLGHAKESNRTKALNPEWTTLSPRRIFRMHARGYEVFAYPVNTREDMIKMLNAGVDGIITDNPDVLLQLRNDIRSLQ